MVMLFLVFSLSLSGNTMALYFSEWLCVGLDVDALDSVNKEEGIVVESSDSGDLTVEVDVVQQWGTFLLFLPFSGAFSVHDRDIVGGTKGGNDSSWMAIGFTFDVLE